jgi:hypothetical protein
VGVYFSQADWEAAMSSQGANPLTTISFASSQWTDGMQVSPTYTALVSQSGTAASNGMAVSAVSGYGAPGIADNSTLGHVSNGIWTDVISKYGSTTFSFSDAIYGFGGDFNIANGNGLFISPVGELPYPVSASGASPLPGYNGFIGIVSDQPMDSFLISWGDNGSCSGCVGNSYTLSEFMVGAALPTPEPNFSYVVAGLLILVIGCTGSRFSPRKYKHLYRYLVGRG